MVGRNSYIVFNDKLSYKTSMLPHHYRTWSIISQRQHLQSCWRKCIQITLLIPAVNIITENQKTVILFLNLANLSYVSNCKPTMDSSSRECNSNISNSSTVTTSENIDYSLLTNNDKTVDFLIRQKENDASDTETMVTEETMEINITLSNEENAEKKWISSLAIKFQFFFEMEAKFSTKAAQLLYDILPEEVEVVSKFDKIREKLR